MAYTYAGIDSHKNTHTIVFMDCFHEKIGEMTIENLPNKFDAFFKEAQKYKITGTSFAFGFEDVSAFGRLFVKFLINKNQIVKHVDSSLVASERNAKNILNKTDSVDAECAGRVLINRFDKLPIVKIDEKFCNSSAYILTKKHDVLAIFVVSEQI